MLLVLLVLAAAPAAAADLQSGFDPEDWLQGAEGLYGALRTLESEKKPMVVYFYADWCGYCRQFERELLGKPIVKDYLDGVSAVMINPEKGEKEEELARYYGVRGYPAFFVHSSRSRTLSRVERAVVEEGRVRLLSPHQFVAACEEAAAR